MSLPSSFHRTPVTDLAALGMASSIAQDSRRAMRPRDESGDRKAGVELLEPHWIAAIESATD